MKCAMGFDRDGKLISAAWINEHTSAREARSFCRRGGLRVRTVEEDKARQIMQDNGWSSPNDQDPS